MRSAGEYLMGSDHPDGGWRWIQLATRTVARSSSSSRSAKGFCRSSRITGRGLHHITFKTDASTRRSPTFKSGGYELVDISLDNPHWKEAFLRPSRTTARSFQIAQAAADDDTVAQRLRPSNLDELLS